MIRGLIDIRAFKMSTKQRDTIVCIDFEVGFIIDSAAVQFYANI